VQRHLIRASLTLITCSALTCSGFAELSRPTIGGTLEAFNTSTGMVTIRTADGKLHRAHMDKKSRYKIGERDAGPASFTKGMKVAIRIEGALNESPLQADMLVDWMSSERIVAKVAEAPYETPMGKYPTTSGVAGRIKEEEDTKLDKQLGVMANGGKPEGFYDNTTMNDGNKLMSPSSTTSSPSPIPGPAGPGMVQQPGMSPAEQMRAAQMQVAQMQQQMTAGTSGSNILNEDGESGGGMMGGPSATGMATSGGAGVSVNVQALIVSTDLASRVLIVRGSNSPREQRVQIPPQVSMPALQPGQTVAISGFTDAQGIIQATSVSAVGH
jgi:hypothetical protein